jgi:hypothetical protein
VRRPAALLAATLLAATLIAATLLVGCGDSGALPVAQVHVPGKPDFPAPPRGAVVFARQLGGDVLALGVVPRGRRVVVQASVLGPQGEGVPKLHIAFGSQRAEACGDGCYRATVPRTAAIDVEVRDGPKAVRWRVVLPAPWPPRHATALVERAGRVWRALDSLSIRERLASDERHAVTSTWRIQAPDRVAYQVVDGWAGIVVGDRRWDRPPEGGAWKESGQTRLHQPSPAWVGVADARLLGTGTVSGRPVWRISFFDPRTPAWFEVAVERVTFRTLGTEMRTTAHFMHDVYDSFNRTPPIVPPPRRVR